MTLDAAPRGTQHAPLGLTVADAMVRAPKVRPGTTTVAQARADLLDDHVHAVLVVRDSVLVSVVESADLTSAPPDALAAPAGRLGGRTVPPGTDLESVWRDLTVRRRRRVAVVDDRGRLLGLLCLKRSGRGFCTDDGVRARAAERGSP